MNEEALREEIAGDIEAFATRWATGSDIWFALYRAANMVRRERHGL